MPRAPRPRSSVWRSHAISRVPVVSHFEARRPEERPTPDQGTSRQWGFVGVPLRHIPEDTVRGWLNVERVVSGVVRETQPELICVGAGTLLWWRP